ncbi:dihydrofolate reductase-thymidylate synthase [Brazilian marseillevirus]|uniref:dihydrofolate reductase n=1 Tax=Brazilian marseillevirus TaxID=1813599 RepID=UPI000781B40D|nr:dihydrofolate reductase [Brazilian marseillevirus]AMQ10988.1 dihydrofolate reductase-thymidylate synthase [Brazilian marseillevirus]
MSKYFMVFACDENGGIGKQGQIPWHLPEDLAIFQRMTFGRTIIYGRKTLESFPGQKPLTKRRNLILSRDGEFSVDGAEVCGSLEEAFSKCEDYSIVIGGESVYTQCLSKYPELCLGVSRTLVFGEHPADKFFSVKNAPFAYLIRDSEKFQTAMFHNYDSGELGYLSLLSQVMNQGNSKEDRTGTGVKSLFAKSLFFPNVSKEFPLLTVKKVNWEKILSELLWFLSGSTDSKVLEEAGNDIWVPNSSKEFQKSRGLENYEEGDCGPIYSFQWRHAGAKYVDCKQDYKGQGEDQILEMVRLIQEEPTSRRILLEAWNVADLKNMVLPPCHKTFQVYVRGNELDAQVYQRSADLALGVPFNIASYACLLSLLAKRTGKVAGNLTMTFGDIHVYNNHMENAQKMLERAPHRPPSLEITNIADDGLWNLRKEDFVLHDYSSYGALNFGMAV